MLPNSTSPKHYLLLLLTLFTASVAVAQSKKEINPPSVKDELKSSGNYYYSSFKKGKVTFITGTSSSGLLNYNMQTQEIEFITSKKDTVAFDEMYLVDMITIENDIFYYDNSNASVLKLMDTINGRKLLVKEEIPATTDAATMAKTFYLSNQEDYMPATTDSFLSIFPTHSAELKNYIAENNLELKTGDEIKKLLQYASGL